MKNLKLLFLFFPIPLFIVVSCNTDDKLPIKARNGGVESENYLKFKGLTVNHQGDVPADVLHYDEKDFQKLMVENLPKLNKNLKTLSDFQYPTLEKMAEIADKIEAKYPNVYRPTTEEASEIRQDFPELTDEEIDENLETIDEYYEQNMTYEIILEVLALNSNENIQSRTADYVGGLCEKEFWIIAGRPRAARSVEDATNNANSATASLYTNANGFDRHLDRGDAFRHAYWNSLIAAYYGAKKDDKQKGLELAEAFTDAHEECAESLPTYKDYDNEMDLHNNWLGRVVFDQTAEYKVIGSWPFKLTVLYTPSDQDYVNNIKLKADNALIAHKSMAGIDVVRGHNLIFFEGP